VLDLASERLTPVATPFTEFGSMRAVGERAVFRAGAPDHPASIVALDLASGRHSMLKRATDILDRTDPHLGDYLTRIESVEFPTTGGETAFGLFYPPRNPDYAPEAEERPPLLVKCHGGPTSAASSTLNLGVQYWTSRGIAVLDVNYRGSTGFGRAYRDRLQLNWGVVDVDDCVAGARFLAAQGRVDGKRCVISGGSARLNCAMRDVRLAPGDRAYHVQAILGIGHIAASVLHRGGERGRVVFDFCVCGPHSRRPVKPSGARTTRRARVRASWGLSQMTVTDGRAGR
jgi:hypothetical protein